MFFGVSFFFSFPLYGLFVNGMNCLGHTFKEVTAYFSLHFRLMTSIEDFFGGGRENYLQTSVCTSEDPGVKARLCHLQNKIFKLYYFYLLVREGHPETHVTHGLGIRKMYEIWGSNTRLLWKCWNSGNPWRKYDSGDININILEWKNSDF